jgi:hypothetical protein
MRWKTEAGRTYQIVSDSVTERRKETLYVRCTRSDCYCGYSPNENHLLLQLALVIQFRTDPAKIESYVSWFADRWPDHVVLTPSRNVTFS